MQFCTSNQTQSKYVPVKICLSQNMSLLGQNMSCQNKSSQNVSYQNMGIKICRSKYGRSKDVQEAPSGPFLLDPTTCYLLCLPITFSQLFSLAKFISGTICLKGKCAKGKCLTGKCQKDICLKGKWLINISYRLTLGNFWLHMPHLP